MLPLAIISGLILLLCLAAIATSARTTRSPLRAIGLSFLLLCNMPIPGLICGVAVNALAENHARPTLDSFLPNIQEAARQSDRASILSSLEAAGLNARVVEGSYFHHDSQEPRITDFSDGELNRAASSIYLLTEPVRLKPRRLFEKDRHLLAEFLFDANQHLIAWHHCLALKP